MIIEYLKRNAFKLGFKFLFRYCFFNVFLKKNIAILYNDDNHLQIRHEKSYANRKSNWSK